MKSLESKTLMDAIQFASRWGFLSRDIYFKYFCDKRRAMQYIYWKNITSSGYFVRSKVNDQVCYLTTKGKKLLSEESNSARFHVYIEHDTLVADLILMLQIQKKIVRYWTEAELKKSQLTAYSVLGGERVDRYPDAVIDVNANGQIERYAIEIERKVKSRFRYNKMVLNYSYYKKLKGVLFGCDRLSTAKAIQNSFFDSQLAKSEFKIGTYHYSEFEEQGLHCKVQSQIGFEPIKRFLNCVDDFESEDQIRQPSNLNAS